VPGKQPTKALVLSVLVVGAVRRLVLEVRDDRKAPVAISKGEIVAQRVADGAWTIEPAQAFLDGPRSLRNAEVRDSECRTRLTPSQRGAVADTPTRAMAYLQDLAPGAGREV
jgi:hypothetical protein